MAIIFPGAAVKPWRSPPTGLFSLLDPTSGGVPNLGANDGAYILPLTICPFEDYRPLIASRSAQFHGIPVCPAEFGMKWHSGSVCRRLTSILLETPATWATACTDAIRGDTCGRINTRTVPRMPTSCTSTCGGAGLNIARDAGTYLYNVDAPWDNALTHTAVHNTVSVDGCEQMTPCQPLPVPGLGSSGKIKQSIEADPDILQRDTGLACRLPQLGVRHERSVTVFSDEHWEVQDCLLFIKGQTSRQRTFRLHWLLPDWDWQMDEIERTASNCACDPRMAG